MRWKYEAKQNNSGIGGIECLIVFEDGPTKLLSNHGYHSPDGFQIGYGGSGPADLAYSILTDYFVRTLMPNGVLDLAGTKQSVEILHQQFKRDFIVKEKTCLEISSDEIEEWFSNKEISL